MTLASFENRYYIALSLICAYFVLYGFCFLSYYAYVNGLFAFVYVLSYAQVDTFTATIITLSPRKVVVLS